MELGSVSPACEPACRDQEPRPGRSVDPSQRTQQLGSRRAPVPASARRVGPASPGSPWQEEPLWSSGPRAAAEGMAGAAGSPLALGQSGILNCVPRNRSSFLTWIDTPRGLWREEGGLHRVGFCVHACAGVRTHGKALYSGLGYSRRCKKREKKKEEAQLSPLV